MLGLRQLGDVPAGILQGDELTTARQRDDLSVFEDHTALIFELFAYDEVKIEVGHTNRLPISIRKQIYHRAIGSPTETGCIQVYSCSCVAFPHSKKLSAPSRRSRRERGYKISVQWWVRILKDWQLRRYDK
jgi:hypothetical protein